MSTVWPGFVGGLDASVEALVSDVSLETRERLKRGKALPAKQDATVEAWLTEKPLVRLAGWRAIGPDAAATSATSNPDGSISLTYEEVPDFFRNLGVGEPPAIQFTAGILTEQTSMDPESGKRRLLRALDVVLKQDRVGTATQWTTGAGLDGSFAQFDVITTRALDFRVRSYIDLESQWTPPAVASLQDRLAGNWTDDTTDERLIARCTWSHRKGWGRGRSRMAPGVPM
ncbi:hypothetical protein [Verrucomicrobium spinosum]|uniref:hypothetical protein n=1 Tax=Verrucomicrobium spinosum TaxID=2736 RepID=UPI0012E26FA5|nr:hypothetical protein [Verrucomicrobium spinosum]